MEHTASPQPSVPLAHPRPAPARPAPGERRRRRFPWLLVLGVLLLLGTATGSRLALNNGAGESPKPAATPARSEAKSVAIAYVDVESGLTPLYPVRPGRVTAVMLEENKEVEADTPLFRLDDTLAKGEVAQAKIDLNAAKVRLTQAKRLPKQHAAKVAAQQALIQVRSREAEAARAQHDKAARYYKEKLGGSAEDVKAALKLAEKAEAAVKAEEKNLSALEALDPNAGVELAQLDVQAKQEQLTKAEHGLRECTVRAPVKGRVLRSQLSVGTVLGPSPQHPVLLFCPSVPLIVRAEVEQEFASRVEVGQIALIQDDATGGGSWRGQVKSLSGWYSHRRSMLLEPLQFNDVRTLECIVTLDQDQDLSQLRIGQRVRVSLARSGG
jgi:multidrug resistance efflux pump